jgi:Holliday junction resolvase RusA-like endonuclease
MDVYDMAPPPHGRFYIGRAQSDADAMSKWRGWLRSQGGGRVIEAYFTVPFVRGKGRARFVRGSGMTYTPTETTNAMAEIQAAFLATKAPKAPRGTPVSVTIQVERHLPGSRPKRVEREPDLVKPDADNVAKLVLDALNGGRVGRTTRR